jgi:hypothetical protein
MMGRTILFYKVLYQTKKKNNLAYTGSHFSKA